jgi:hypothetical protein
MALCKSHILSQLSGTTAGITYGSCLDNKSCVVRVRPLPSHSLTTIQQKHKSDYSSVLSRWRKLSAPQRFAWQNYASSLADPILRNARALFIRTFLLYTTFLRDTNHFFTPPYTAPLKPGLLSLKLVRFRHYSTPPYKVRTTFANPNDENVTLFCYISNPVLPTIYHYRHKWTPTWTRTYIAPGLESDIDWRFSDLNHVLFLKCLFIGYRYNKAIRISPTYIFRFGFANGLSIP